MPRMLLAVILAPAVLAAAVAARAATAGAVFDDPVAYCRAVGTIDQPGRHYAGPAVPDWLAAALRRALGVPDTAPLEPYRHARWRCGRGKVLACAYGANIPCGTKADRRRKPSEAERGFCRDHPDAADIPAYVTGRATVYLWRCRAGRPVIERQVQQVDAEGYAAAFWHLVAPAAAEAQPTR